VEYLLSNWQRLEGAILDKKVFLILDYDGTLSPIAASPKLAHLPDDTREILRSLNKNRSFQIAIISGRSLKDIRKLIGIDGIIYAGNHGFELKGPGLKFINKGAVSKQRSLRAVYKSLRNKLSLLNGILVEDKGLTLSVHYRLASKKDSEILEDSLNTIVRKWVKEQKIRVTKGKKVFEIRPAVNWDKGKIVKWLIGRKDVFKPGTVPICIGDDHTDEDMFKVIGKKGWTVCVGRSNPFSKAGYYLKDTKEVKKFLNKLYKTKT